MKKSKDRVKKDKSSLDWWVWLLIVILIIGSIIGLFGKAIFTSCPI